MIWLKNVWKKYGGRVVLRDVTTEINDGLTCLIGPNGAGKSTLLKIITGFEKADRGEVKVAGRKVSDICNIKDIIHYMPEQMTLYPEYYTGEFLSIYHQITGYRNREIYKRLDIEKVATKKIKHLSKGWHQRIKLYLALASQKQYLILDEPFEGFDPLQMRKIFDIIKDEHEKGKKFLLSIHQLLYAKKICNYFILLADGRIVAEGILNELAQQFKVENGDIEEIFIRAVEKRNG